MSITFNLRKFDRQVKSLGPELMRVAPQVLKSQGKLAARDLAKATPPFVAKGGKKGTFKQSWSVQRKAGIGAVTRDVNKVYQQLQEMGIYKAPRNKELGAAIQEAGKKGNIGLVRSLLKNAKINNLVRFSAEAGFHTKAKGRRRTSGKKSTIIRRGTKKVIVLRKNEVQKYIKQVSEGVGEAKAGWKYFAAKFGAKLPNWITKHGTPGTVLDRSKDKEKPYIKFINQFRHQRDFSHLRIVNAMLLNRKRSMANQAKKLLQYEAKKLNSR